MCGHVESFCTHSSHVNSPSHCPICSTKKTFSFAYLHIYLMVIPPLQDSSFISLIVKMFLFFVSEFAELIGMMLHPSMDQRISIHDVIRTSWVLNGNVSHPNEVSSSISECTSESKKCDDSVTKVLDGFFIWCFG